MASCSEFFDYYGSEVSQSEPILIVLQLPKGGSATREADLNHDTIQAMIQHMNIPSGPSRSCLSPPGCVSARLSNSGSAILPCKHTPSRSTSGGRSRRPCRPGPSSSLARLPRCSRSGSRPGTENDRARTATQEFPSQKTSASAYSSAGASNQRPGSWRLPPGELAGQGHERPLSQAIFCVVYSRCALSTPR